MLLKRSTSALEMTGHFGGDLVPLAFYVEAEMAEPPWLMGSTSTSQRVRPMKSSAQKPLSRSIAPHTATKRRSASCSQRKSVVNSNSCSQRDEESTAEAPAGPAVPTDAEVATRLRGQGYRLRVIAPEQGTDE